MSAETRIILTIDGELRNRPRAYICRECSVAKHDIDCPCLVVTFPALEGSSNSSGPPTGCLYCDVEGSPAVWKELRH